MKNYLLLSEKTSENIQDFNGTKGTDFNHY